MVPVSSINLPVQYHQSHAPHDHSSQSTRWGAAKQSPRTMRTYSRENRTAVDTKNVWNSPALPAPMQVPSKGQWWSCAATHVWQWEGAMWQGTGGRGAMDARACGHIHQSMRE